jgi:hypothetical protein
MFAICSTSKIQDACDALLEADRLTANAICIIGRSDVEASTGLPAEMLLSLGARRTGADARMLVNAAATLRWMPATSAAFERGDLSWGQVRAIVVSVRSVDGAGRTQIDELVRAAADHLTRMDPDELLARVDDAVSGLRADLALAREDRQIERGFLAIQGRFDGSATFYGEADAQSTATLLEALDAHAERPVAADEDDAPSRGEQHLDALIAMCEESLNGGHTERTRPRLIATIDVDALRRDAHAEGARVLWSLAGRTPRLTPLATEALICDSTVVPVIFEGAQPIAVGDASAPISSKVRSALIARDGGCRFPGCRAPVSWCDAHHIRARVHEGPTVIENLILLCRRCHRRIHRYRWRINLGNDGICEFRRQSRTFASTPRALPRE